MRHRFIHQFEQAALVHRLFLLLHHFVNLLLVLWLGMEACLRECGDGILMVLGRDQLLRFLEVFLVFLPPLLLLFRLLGLCILRRLTFGCGLLRLHLELSHVGD